LSIPNFEVTCSHFKFYLLFLRYDYTAKTAPAHNLTIIRGYTGTPPVTGEIHNRSLVHFNFKVTKPALLPLHRFIDTPASAMIKVSQQLLLPGQPCTLQGLQGQPAFNGNPVSIVEFLHDQGRYRVQSMDPSSPLPCVLAIKQQNLRPLGAPIQQQPPAGQLPPEAGGSPMGKLLPPGACFVLQGLKAQPSFNGQHVLIVEYLHDQERYRVQPADPNGPLPPFLAIRTQNLIPTSAAAGIGKKQSSRRSLLTLLKMQSKSKQEVCQPLPPRPGVQRSSSVPAITATGPPRVKKQRSQRSSLSASKESSMSTATLTPAKNQTSERTQTDMVPPRVKKQTRQRSSLSASKEPSTSNATLIPGKKQTSERTPLEVSKRSTKSNSELLSRKKGIERELELNRVQPADPHGARPPTGQAGQLLPPGARFVLQGLQAQPNFNGQHIIIMQYLHAQERYRVQPADPNGPLPPFLAIRAQNLTPASASVGISMFESSKRSLLTLLKMHSKSTQEVCQPLPPRYGVQRSSSVPAITATGPPRVKKQTSQRSSLSASKEPSTSNATLSPGKKQTSGRTPLGVSKRSSKSNSELLTRKNDIERDLDFLENSITLSSNNQKIRRTLVTGKKQTSQRTMVGAAKSTRRPGMPIRTVSCETSPRSTPQRRKQVSRPQEGTSTASESTPPRPTPRRRKQVYQPP
jgi:hypothetical protein